METQHVALAISGANFALTWGVALYMYLANKSKATNERISQMERDIDDKLDQYADRIARLEEASRNALTHEHLRPIEARVNVTAESVAAMSGQLKSMDDTLKLILSQITQRGMK